MSCNDDKLKKTDNNMVEGQKIYQLVLFVVSIALLLRLLYEPCAIRDVESLRKSVSKTTIESSQQNSVSKTGDKSNFKFDSISHKLFRDAVSTSGENGKRKKFVLDENWERGDGGLDDADRRTLGELYYNASSVFEFGLGESTFIAAATNIPRYAGVDSDANWVGMAREKVINQDMDHFRFYFSDIGETKEWGYPEKDLAKNPYDYQLSALMAEQEAFDVYMVDGRYRVACACLSFLHAIKHGGNLDTIRVAIHDNQQKERGYGIFQEVADVVIKNKQLWVYQLKKDRPNIEEELYNLWERHNETMTR